MATNYLHAWELDIEFGSLDAKYAQELCDALVAQYDMPVGIFMDTEEKQYVVMLPPPMERPGLIFYSALTPSSVAQQSDQSVGLETIEQPANEPVASQPTGSAASLADVDVNNLDINNFDLHSFHVNNWSEDPATFPQYLEKAAPLSLEPLDIGMLPSNFGTDEQVNNAHGHAQNMPLQQSPASLAPMAPAPTSRAVTTAQPSARVRGHHRAESRRVTKTQTAHIPRPRNSWIIYRQDRTKDLRAQDSSLTASEISRIVSTLWRDETPHVRAYYQQLAQDEAQAHRERYPNYRYRARRPVDRHSKVDTAAFWESLPDLDNEAN